MSYTSAMLITYDYYFPTKGGWYFIGGGLGRYKQDEMQDIRRGFFPNNNVVLPNVPEEKNAGIMIRAGMKTSLVRFSMGCNFTGKNISDYLTFQIGFEPSFYGNDK